MEVIYTAVCRTQCFKLKMVLPQGEGTKWNTEYFQRVYSFARKMSTCPKHECLCRLEPQVMHTLLEWQQKITVAFNYISLPSGGRAYKQLTRSGLVCSVEIILITRQSKCEEVKTQISFFFFCYSHEFLFRSSMSCKLPETGQCACLK